jgi:glycosyltransferase involved in cell wall biosynthesis
VEDGVAGLLAKVRDAGSLADAMRRMIAFSAGEREAMGRAARARVERDYDERRVIDIYLDRVDMAMGRR